MTNVESSLATVAVNAEPGGDHRKPPKAWWAIVGIVPVALALAIAAAHFVYTKDAGSPFRVFADVIGAVLVVLSVVAQSVLVILDAWGIDESDRTRSITSIVSIVIGIVGGTFVAIGALNAHGA
ncbi:hypothetical protein [Curtobacterium sp. MCSS17_015]|uniref:hypothetical protein n=1 Tax=Curtobacterium sp. MCSS17_015 TaxID=2175666 RepID=UPI0011B5D25B|nr:hypothetical protein [Curtobacterium sp. MCSS17_015]WIB25415.1 hypothetical protein DEJ18_10135 [Curtobacterium sp. MCSS17_015]